MSNKYKKGDKIAFIDRYGDISIYTFHSIDKENNLVNVYLHADMSTEHLHVQELDEIIPNEDVIKMLRNE